MENKALWRIGLALCAALALAAQGNVKNQSVQLINSIQGPDLFRAYCASCHGLDATGKGPVAASMKVPPSDLTRIAIRYRGVFPAQRVRETISGEVQSASSHGSREMPVWGPIFSQVTMNVTLGDVDLGKVRIDNLARYLRDIQAMK